MVIDVQEFMKSGYNNDMSQLIVYISLRVYALDRMSCC